MSLLATLVKAAVEDVAEDQAILFPFGGGPTPTNRQNPAMGRRWRK
jgi:hypothetical protein